MSTKTYLDFIVEAINGLQEKASSPQAIKKYLAANYAEDPIKSTVSIAEINKSTSKRL